MCQTKTYVKLYGQKNISDIFYVGRKCVRPKIMSSYMGRKIFRTYFMSAENNSDIKLCQSKCTEK